MKIIKSSQSGYKTLYTRRFCFEGSRYFHGFSFDCDKDGNVDESKLEGLAKDNYRQCLSGMVDGRKIVDEGVNVYEHFYRIPAVGECVCGAHVTLSAFTNTCDRCERDYNSAGQMLAPREQWGEETGEHWSEII